MSRRRYHFVGHNEKGEAAFEECSTGKLLGVRPIVEGKPILPGTGLAMVYPDEDGDHVEMEDVIEPSGGPAQVATERYRRGWDRMFAN
jgi:hypothetical protein